MLRAQGDATYERAVDYAYDGLNRLRTETQCPAWPATTTLLTPYTYDGNGNRVTPTDPLTQTTTFAYDWLNRPITMRYGDGQTPNVSYTYDQAGNRVEMTDGAGTTTYSYDEQSRPLTVTTPGPHTVAYRYDRDGKRTKLIYPDGSDLTYDFDNAGRLVTMTDWLNNVTSYEYYPDGRLMKISYPNGTSAEYSYDSALRLTDVWNKQGADTISRHSYTLDLAGNRTEADELLPQLGTPGTTTPSVTKYRYDGIYRLTGVVGPDRLAAYGYDPAGNRLAKVEAGTVTRYVYDRADRLEMAASGQVKVVATDVNDLRAEIDRQRGSAYN